MKTIVIAANTSWYLVNFRRSTILMLIKKGYRVVCCAPDAKHKDDICKLGSGFKMFYLDNAGANPVRDFKSFLGLLKLYGVTKPDIILTFTPKVSIYSSFAGACLSIPVVANVSGLGVGFTAGSMKGFVYRALYKYASKAFRYVFFQNSHDMNFFKEQFRLAVCKYDLLPGSGVNLDEYEYKPLVDKKKIRFGLFCRMIEEKGVRLFVEAACKIKDYADVEFVLAGPLDEKRKNGITRDEIASWVEFGYLKYLGDLPDIRDAIKECDCVVLPSFYPEGTPRTLIEAAAIGRAIITTDTPGCRDTVNGLNGYLITPKTSESLAFTMLAFSRLGFFKRKEMGEESRKLAESNFDEGFVLSRYESVVEKFCVQ